MVASGQAPTGPIVEVLACASACEQIPFNYRNNTGRLPTWCASPKSGCLAWCKEERLKSAPEHATYLPS